MNKHPSFYELDRQAIGLETSATAREHVQSCQRCRTHLQRLEQREPPPAWLSSIDSAPRRKALSKPSRQRFLLWAFAGGLALTAAVLFLVFVPRNSATFASQTMTALDDTGPLDRPSADQPYTTIKGAPSVGVYRKRGDTNAVLWNGEERFQAGDRVRLKVVPEGFTHLTVYSAAEASVAYSKHDWTRLYESDIDGHDVHTLPVAWEIDDTAGDDYLLIVLSRRALTSDDVRELSASSDGGVSTVSNTDRWATYLRFRMSHRHH